MRRLIFYCIVFVFSVNVFAQEKTVNRHEFRAFYGDRISFNIANLLTTGFLDAISGSATTVKGYGVYGLGYRYSVGRVGLGADISYIGYRNDVRLKAGNPIDFKMYENYFFVLPSVDLTYIQRGVFRFYGGISVGTALGLSSEKSQTDDGKNYLSSASPKNTSVNLAFQVNPIGLRIGNDKIGGFLEAGFGMKGLLNLGVSLKL